RRPPTRRLLVLHRPAGGARHSLRRRPQQLRVLLHPGPDPRGTRPGPLSPPPGMRRPGTRVRQTGAGHPGPTCDDDHRGGGRPMNAQRGIPSSHQNAFRLYGPQFQNKPAELYRQMRTDYGPVAPVLLDGDIPAWLVIGYREVTHVLNRPETFARSSRRWNAWDLVPENWPLYPMVTRTPNILYSEGEEHRRRATAISDALSGADQHEVRQYAVQAADRLIDGFCAASRADLRADYASRLPAIVLGRLYGLDQKHAEVLAEAMTTMIDSGPDAVKAQQFLLQTMGTLVAERRKQPGPDVVSRLVHHPAKLRDEELIPDLV